MVPPVLIMSSKTITSLPSMLNLFSSTLISPVKRCLSFRSQPHPPSRTLSASFASSNAPLSGASENAPANPLFLKCSASKVMAERFSAGMLNFFKTPSLWMFTVKKRSVPDASISLMKVSMLIASPGKNLLSCLA